MLRPALRCFPVLAAGSVLLEGSGAGGLLAGLVLGLGNLGKLRCVFAFPVGAELVSVRARPVGGSESAGQRGPLLFDFSRTLLKLRAQCLELVLSLIHI